MSKITFGIEYLQSVTKEQFLEEQKHVNADLEKIWNDANPIKDATKETKEPAIEHTKEPKFKGPNKGSISK